MAHKLPPIYEKSFVGIWKRKFRSGRPDQNLVLLIFNKNGTVYGQIGPGSRKGGGTVLEIEQDPNSTEKGVLTINFNGKKVHWNYTLNRNNEFKADFNPIQSSDRIPPTLNELLLVGQGARHLYAFVSHPFRRVVTESDVMAKVDP